MSTNFTILKDEYRQTYIEEERQSDSSCVEFDVAMMQTEGIE